MKKLTSTVAAILLVATADNPEMLKKNHFSLRYLVLAHQMHHQAKAAS
ncbi:hypothetical protein PPAR_a0908 [Pseudoalteromonas paragorgicola KMM 3548]|nr:hypothetical protein [Pseudoalteromonas distincta KMM 3548]